MPNKDWYWDQFSVDVKQGELDLSDAQTSALAETGVEGRADYMDDDRVKYETRFIDDLYGTDNRAWEGKDAPYDDGGWRRKHDAAIGTMGSGRSGKGGKYEYAAHATWGLDLVRDWTGKENLKVGSDEHYQHQTRGRVDWAHYYNDNAYQKAYKEYRKEASHKTPGTLKEFLTPSGAGDYISNTIGYAHGGETADHMATRVDFLREYAGHSTVDEVDSKALRDTWDNQYVDQFDPETAQPYSPTYLEVPDLWSDANITPTLTPKKVGPPAGLPTLGDMQRTQVTVPTGLKNWGAVSSAPQAKFQAGGQAGAEAGGGGGES